MQSKTWIRSSVELLNQGKPLLQDIKFSKADIELACRELKSSSSLGPDGVPALLLKTACKELSHPLYLRWRAVHPWYSVILHTCSFDTWST